MQQRDRIDGDILKCMNEKLAHRGPDASAEKIERNLGIGFNRLSIIDIDNGMQPIFNESESIFTICNGEIYNYKELTQELEAKGHRFRTRSDCECIIHLYEEYGVEFIEKLNGQFAFFLFDRLKNEIICARDHVGIAPFFYTITDGLFIFGSEIKAIIEHPAVMRKLDITGLDQIMTFPGLISPRTMFQGIFSLKPGHRIIIKDYTNFRIEEYWDVLYPENRELEHEEKEDYYVERLDELLTKAVKYRLQADVPVGFYVSGGLDSSVIAGKINQIDTDKKESFSIDFSDRDISEGKYQRLMASNVNTRHNEYNLGLCDLVGGLNRAVYHAECSLKESYNIATMKLAEMAHAKGIKVILTGEGADELFGGYIGYRFDKFNQMSPRQKTDDWEKEQLWRDKVWGDSDFLYEINFYAYEKIKREIYSGEVNAVFHDINCLNHSIIDKNKIQNVDLLHKRSYIDFKLRMADHLLGDHGDRMAFSHSVEARFPFLDKDVISFVLKMPPFIKLKDFDEKYVLKRAAKKYVPEEILKRPKFAFTAPGSSEILKSDREFVEDILSFERIKRHGIFNPEKVEELKKLYLQPDFKLNVPYDSDFLMIVLTTEMLLDKYKMVG
ncbi:asparagine synthase (glutamine-hydrolysing) [Kineothrix alysoides]|uniref:asparagine synthase (glutamine-hydrolyzing) n=2 Tax=Kineothrix alysoides TaxID=1469948 RepID=A0A4R1QY43_9FIRM|nr:asparagine synthase (glutamine-hydrolysing) [Kineothrix alysoides]